MTVAAKGVTISGTITPTVLPVSYTHLDVYKRQGEQPHRIGEDARRELRGDENRVQQNARDESAVERREPPNVFVGVIVMRMRHKLRLTINPCGGVPDAVFRYLPCRPAAADELFGH